MSRDKNIVKKIRKTATPAITVPPKKQPITKVGLVLKKMIVAVYGFLNANKIGIVTVSFAVTVFFWPLIVRIGSYSEGGDAMFNAWTLARNHHCILREGCASYVDSNIYFPAKDSMLFSETQLSAGVLTLPLHFINKNPVFSYNVWTITSYLLAGVFMYLLAKKLSKNNEFISVLSALIFTFAPIKLGAGAPSHLQNLSIFYLPLIFLIVIHYLEKKRLKILGWLMLVLVLQFYASWYQMFFVLIALSTFIVGGILLKNMSMRSFLLLCATIAGSVILTLPLATEYTRFSKQNKASFTISDQIVYSSRVTDYFVPYENSIAGKLYDKLAPSSRKKPRNPDSYSNHSMTLYFVGLSVIGLSLVVLRRKKKQMEVNLLTKLKNALSLGLVGMTGFLLSLGPIVKLKDNFFSDSLGSRILLAIPGPWLLITMLFPQLSFIRAIGRISIIFLFALCCLLAYFPFVLKAAGFKIKTQKILIVLVFVGILFEVAPLHRYQMSTRKEASDLSVPAIYEEISKIPEIDNIIILREKQEYINDGFPFVRAEDVLWSGYHNKNIFNGYSGYEPKNYASQLADFTDFGLDDIEEMKQTGLKYILLDLKLTSPTSNLIESLRLIGDPIITDDRYELYRL